MFKILPKFTNFNLFGWLGSNTDTTNSSLRFKNASSKSNTYKILKKTPVKYKNGTGYIKTTTKREKSNQDALKINTDITDNEKSPLGHYEYTINKSTATINYGYIETYLPQRRNGLGEILRLSSIIEFIENGIKTLDIGSYPDAIPFHLKCRLKPNLTTSYITLKILNNIKNNPKVQPYYRQMSEKLIIKIENENSVSLSKGSKKFVNEFIESYIKQHLHNWQDTKIRPFLPMELTESRIKQFANFYNKLFKKHGINYKIWSKYHTKNILHKKS